MVKREKISKTPIYDFFNYLHKNIQVINGSKIFAGLMIIILNIASKFVTFKLSKSMESYLKYTFSRQLLVFAITWMGTRDIYTALGLTAVFTILSDYLFNEESKLCIVKKNYRILHKLLDTNEDGVVTESEMAAAMAIIEKAKRGKQRKQQKEAFKKFEFEKYAPAPIS